jgi:hypothetical protein
MAMLELTRRITSKRGRRSGRCWENLEFIIALHTKHTITSESCMAGRKRGSEHGGTIPHYWVDSLPHLHPQQEGPEFLQPPIPLNSI